MSAPERMTRHDRIAIPAVTAAWAAYGFECYPFGQEQDTEAFRKRLAELTDPTSLRLRFRPDRVFLRPGLRSLLCEVKSEWAGSANFAVECSSFIAGRIWTHEATGHLVYCFFDGPTETISCCWGQAIPAVTCIHVPDRPGWQDRQLQLAVEFPGVRFRPMEWRRPSPGTPLGMSGTPYFLVPKASEYLRAMRRFVRDEGLRCEEPPSDFQMPYPPPPGAMP